MRSGVTLRKHWSLPFLVGTAVLLLLGWAALREERDTLTKFQEILLTLATVWVFLLLLYAYKTWDEAAQCRSELASIRAQLASVFESKKQPGAPEAAELPVGDSATPTPAPLGDIVKTRCPCCGRGYTETDDHYCRVCGVELNAWDAGEDV